MTMTKDQKAGRAGGSMCMTAAMLVSLQLLASTVPAAADTAMPPRLDGVGKPPPIILNDTEMDSITAGARGGVRGQALVKGEMNHPKAGYKQIGAKSPKATSTTIVTVGPPR
jgi:hypothetical protein